MPHQKALKTLHTPCLMLPSRQAIMTTLRGSRRIPPGTRWSAVKLARVKWV